MNEVEVKEFSILTSSKLRQITGLIKEEIDYEFIFENNN